MATTEQLKLIHVARRELALDEESYRDILREHAGVTSAKELTNQGVEAVLKHFRRLGFRVKRSKPRDHRHPDSTLTPRQQDLVSALFGDLGWGLKRRMGFTKRLCQGNPWPQTVKQGQALIEALKAMRAREYSERTERAQKGS
jgi:phage gp16-like protein